MTAQNWGFTGPSAVTWFLKESGEIEKALPPVTFYPITFRHRNQLMMTRFKIEEQLNDETYGVHFWARRMKPRLEEKEKGVPRVRSYMASLINKHGITPKNAPIPPKVNA